jgi:pimeloyl-ACP methyl ester carboxylesterase
MQRAVPANPLLMEANFSDRSAPIILLRPGVDGPAIFIAHGMAGSPAEFHELVEYIDTAKPIYGLQAKGNDGLEEPYDRIEDLAKYYLEAIKKIRPEGPYTLIGYSLGGLVTLEMAQRLSSDGVALLTMVESYPHSAHISLRQQLRLWLHSPKNRGVGHIQKQSPEDHRIYDSAYRAWRSYKPKFYPGKICFVRAEVITAYPDDPIAVWGKLAKEIVTRTAPGDHHEILTKNFKLLGSIISQCLAEAPETLG